LGDANDNGIGLIGSEAGAEHVTHFAEESHFTGTLFEFIDPGFEVLLGLLEGFFGFFSFRDVASDALDADGVAVAVDEVGADFEGDAVTVLGEDFEFARGGGVGGDLAVDHLASGLLVVWSDELDEVHLKCFGAREAGDTLGGFVERGEIAFQVVGVDDVDTLGGFVERGEIAFQVVGVDDVVGVVEQLTIASLHGAQGFFHLPSVRDITDDSIPSLNQTRGVAEGAVLSFEKTLLLQMSDAIGDVADSEGLPIERPEQVSVFTDLRHVGEDISRFSAEDTLALPIAELFHLLIPIGDD
jgi:hypothetical protein